jgi:hypothetical protein
MRSEKFEAKTFNWIFNWTSEMHTKLISFRFISLRSERKFEAKPAHTNEVGYTKKEKCLESSAVKIFYLFLF